MVENKYTHEYYNELQTKLYSAVISDILDELGYRNQTMDPEIRPLTGDTVLVGRAKTVLAADVYRIPQEAYLKQMEALDSIKEGEIFVATVSGSRRSAFFGELMATATMQNGGRGAIIFGLTRDTSKIKQLNFPLFTCGFRPTDSLGRNEVIDYDIPVGCGSVTVNPNDLIFADIDGIVVIPSAVEEEVISKAMVKVSKENVVRDGIMKGMSVKEAYSKYGVL
ncbi:MULTISPECIES: RraA family protein [unclassified Paenibacillus]|uniref:RraA family protein n=1 Tax=unclassified Paenibacillus TaxID=185978 RepID=UPI001AE538CD|nr:MULTISPECIES: RraA family protein [unclassified Paenibacillus]MBP1154901.1 regulator of RNase E activity RraA [Paenibacillus sp. PvP091]MBP1169715.1 regulator of RNase E activity RraA [Paenibacillus sp. PvR098]MBP2440743.1 regulator of RNase E activity RraA [Paenibacillus sp. PvP052]